MSFRSFLAPIAENGSRVVADERYTPMPRRDYTAVDRFCSIATLSRSLYVPPLGNPSGMHLQQQGEAASEQAALCISSKLKRPERPSHPSEIAADEIVRAAPAAPIHSGRGFINQVAVCIERSEQSGLVETHAGMNMLQRILGHEERRFNSAIVPPEAHGAPCRIVVADWIRKTQCHGSCALRNRQVACIVSTRDQRDSVDSTRSGPLRQGKHIRPRGGNRRYAVELLLVGGTLEQRALHAQQKCSIRRRFGVGRKEPAGGSLATIFRSIR